jgi:hypothetical protein
MTTQIQSLLTGPLPNIEFTDGECTVVAVLLRETSRPTHVFRRDADLG